MSPTRTRPASRPHWIAAFLASVVMAATSECLAQPSSGESAPEPTEVVLPEASDLAPEATAALRSLRIVGSAFKPRENDVTYTVDSNGSCTYVTAGDSSTVWNTPIYLPQGATVDTLRVYYYDTSASNLTVWFTVYDLYGSIVDEWSASSSTTAGNSFNDSVQIGHVVDYDVYSYVVNWRPNAVGSTLRLCGIRIFYTP